MSTVMKTLTIRLPLALYQTTSDIATRRHLSFNALVQEGLLALLKAEEEARLYEAFGQLGEDAAAADVEFAAPAQWEVVRRGNA